MRGAALLLAGFIVTATATGEEAGRPVRDGRALFLARCSACHDPSRVNHRIAGRDEWREIVFRMQRMPQSGITPGEAAQILTYLAGGASEGVIERLGGREVWGEEWISVLETAGVREGLELSMGGLAYATLVRDGGREVTLRRGKKSWTVSLTPDGKPGETARIRRWKVGSVLYEVHLILYEVRNGEARVGRALRRRP